MLAKPLAIACACLLAALAYTVWDRDRTKQQLHAETYARKAAEGQVLLERATREHEQEIANAASTKYQSAVTALQDELNRRPIGPVYVRVPVRAGGDVVPGAAAAPGGSDDPATGPEPGTVEINIERPISAYGYDCARVAEQLSSLQSWVLSR